MAYSRQTDTSHMIRLASSIDRCFWSRGVAMNGDSMKIHVETSHVQDGARVVLKIMEKTANRGQSDREITELESSDIASNELVLEHTLELAEDAESTEQSRKSEYREFFLLAEIPDYGINNEKNPSNTLTVDAAPFLFSE